MKFVIRHRYNKRILREDGKLSHCDNERFILEFDSRKSAHSFLTETTLIPEKYKWNYFDISGVKSRTNLAQK